MATARSPHPPGLGAPSFDLYLHRMVSFPTRAAIVVIGAGAAGIAAARVLSHREIPFLVLESRDRVGGRAHTATIGADHRVDLGCEWLHSADRNVLAAMAERNGFTLDRTPPPWSRREEQAGFDCAAQDAFAVAREDFFARMEAAAAEGREGAAAALLEPGGRWNGLLDAISTYYNGAPLTRVSILDFDRYVDTEANWRVVGGYGAMIARFAADLPIRFGCRVTRIRSRERALRLETDHGTIETDGVIITVPTSVLSAGAIRFDPAFDDQLAAAAGLPLGVADKVYLALDEPDAFPPDTRLLGAIDRRDAGSYTLRVRGRPLVEGYFGGDYARHLEAGGFDAFADAARREISAAVGRDIAARLHPIAATAWASDPDSLGSYSHALPGQAEARSRLATPIDERILFAGEATSPHFFSTAHGAWEEGERAAARLIAAGRDAVAAARR